MKQTVMILLVFLLISLIFTNLILNEIESLIVGINSNLSGILKMNIKMPSTESAFSGNMRSLRMFTGNILSNNNLRVKNNIEVNITSQLFIFYYSNQTFILTLITLSLLFVILILPRMA